MARRSSSRSRKSWLPQPLCKYVSLTALLAGMAFGAGAQQRFNYQDAAGNMKIWGATDWVTEISSGNLIDFLGEGKPIFGESKSQGLHVEANTVHSTLLKQGGTTTLQTLTLENAARAVITRASASGQAGANQLVELKAPKAVYISMNEKWTLTGGVSIHRTDPTVSEDTLLTGAAAVLTMYPNAPKNKDELGIKSAHMDSPTMIMKTRRREEVSGTQGQSAWKTYHVNGNADTLDFDGEKRELVLIGNVHMTGDDPLIGGQMDCDKVTITFNDQGQPVRIHGEGRPGVTKIQKKIPPDGASKARAAYPSRILI